MHSNEEGKRRQARPSKPRVNRPDLKPRRPPPSGPIDATYCDALGRPRPLPPPPRQVDASNPLLQKRTLTVEELLSLLRGVRKSVTGWSALCPAHLDHENSLSVAEGHDGKILLYCHVGCEFDDIVEALGLYPSALFPTQQQGIRYRSTPKPRRQWRPLP